MFAGRLMKLRHIKHFCISADLPGCLYNKLETDSEDQDIHTTAD